MTTASSPQTTAAASLGGWDRLAMALLGGAAFAQSFDALRQMAAAIHVRSELTWLFPLLVDGFIAYGVRALLVLRNSRLRARAYVWLLVGGATATSVWANALHAVRLNQQQGPNPDLQLGDVAVAVLSTVAPIAIAGAIHLYIIITRETAPTSLPTETKPATGCGDEPPPQLPPAPAKQPLGEIGRADEYAARRPPRPDTDTPPVTESALPHSGIATAGLGRTPEPDARSSESTDAQQQAESALASDSQRGVESGSESALASISESGSESGLASGGESGADGTLCGVESGSESALTSISESGTDGTLQGQSASASGLALPRQRSHADSAHVRRSARREHPSESHDIGELLVIGRAAPLHRGRPSRQAVAAAIRQRGLTVSNSKLNELMAVLRDERRPAQTGAATAPATRLNGRP